MADFSMERTAKSVHQTLGEAFRAIPSGKRAALLVIADTDGTRAVLAAKIGANWQVASGADKPWGGPVRGTVAVQGSW